MLLPLLPLIPNFTGVWFRLTGTTSASGQLHSLDDGGNNHPKPHRFFQAVPKMFSQFDAGAASRKEASTLHGLEAREGPAQFFDRLNLLECEPASSSGQDADERDQSQLSKVYPPWVKRTITEKDMHRDMPLINILTSLPFFVMANVKDRCVSFSGTSSLAYPHLDCFAQTVFPGHVGNGHGMFNFPEASLIRSWFFRCYSAPTRMLRTFLCMNNFNASIRSYLFY
jgi:hypothetical protein